MRYGYMPFAHFTQWSRSHKLRNHLRPALPRHLLMNDLDRLESESVHILREVVACMRRPVLLYSIGKDSSVLLHLARKAFAPLPLPLLHVDTGWKFREMIVFRERVAVAGAVRSALRENGSGSAGAVRRDDGCGSGGGGAPAARAGLRGPCRDAGADTTPGTAAGAATGRVAVGGDPARAGFVHLRPVRRRLGCDRRARQREAGVLCPPRWWRQRSSTAASPPRCGW